MKIFLRLAATALMILILTPAYPAGADEGGEGPYVSPDEREYSFVYGVVTENEHTWLIINEGVKFMITADTEVLGPDKEERFLYEIKAGTWVYAEGPIDAYGSVEGLRVYIMPGYVEKSGMWRYPFVNAP